MGEIDTSLDVFGRLRTAQAQLICNAQQNYDQLPLIFATKLVGAGAAAYLPNESMTQMTVAGPGDRVVRQTKRYWLYRAGLAQLFYATVAGMQPEAGVTKRIGAFDDNNGVFLEITGTDRALVLRSSTSGAPVDSRVVDDNWFTNLPLDHAMIQLLALDYQWLGAGQVRAAFEQDGEFIVVHAFYNANRKSTSYMKTGSLPFRYELLGVAGGGSMKQGCLSVIREGGSTAEDGVLASANTGIAPITVGASPVAIMSIRLRAAYLRAFLRPISIELANTGNALARARLVLNPTLTGAQTWGSVNEIAEESTAQLAYTEGSGQVIATMYATASGSRSVSVTSDLAHESILGAAADIDGNQDVLALVVDASAANQTVFGEIQYLEMY